MTVRNHQLAIDWSRAGLYNGTLEDLSTPGANLVEDEIVITWGRSEPRATEDSITGTLKAAINNDGRQFSPENTSSPIAGRVLPGTPVRHQVTDPVDGSISTLFLGVLGDPEVDTTNKTFTVDAIDAWGIPGTDKVSTAVYSGQRTGYLIGVVLDTIGWKGLRDIDPGATVVDWWWAEGDDADTAIRKLVQSEGTPAIALVEGGTFVFRDRHHRQIDSNSVTSQGTFTHIKPAGSGPAGDHKILTDSFTYYHGLKYIANSATFTVDQREPGDLAVVWSTDTPITLAANETQTLFVSTNDPFINAVTPVEGLDYVETVGTATISISRTSGASLVMTITASGTPTVISTLQLRANPLPVVRSFKVSTEDTSSVGVYGRQVWNGDLPWCNRYDAQSIANRIVAVYAQPRPTVTLSVSTITAATTSRIYDTHVSDRVTIRNDEMGLNADFYVETVSHSIRKLGLIHTLTIGCQAVEPVRGTNEFTFDVAGQGFDQGVFSIEGIDAPATMFRFDVAGQGFDQGKFAT